MKRLIEARMSIDKNKSKNPKNTYTDSSPSHPRKTFYKTSPANRNSFKLVDKEVGMDHNLSSYYDKARDQYDLQVRKSIQNSMRSDLSQYSNSDVVEIEGMESKINTQHNLGSKNTLESLRNQAEIKSNIKVSFNKPAPKNAKFVQNLEKEENLKTSKFGQNSSKIQKIKKGVKPWNSNSDLNIDHPNALNHHKSSNSQIPQYNPHPVLNKIQTITFPSTYENQNIYLQK